MESYLLALSVLLRPAKHLKQFKYTHYQIRISFKYHYVSIMHLMNNLKRYGKLLYKEELYYVHSLIQGYAKC